MKDIIYPIFLECCNLNEDFFWKSIFKELASGICPRGIYINKNFICCNVKNKEFSYKIEDKPILELYNNIYDLFSKAGILSNEQKFQQKSKFLMFDKNKYTNWGNIRKKNIKDNLLEMYVLEMKKKYCLSTLQAKKLLICIHIGIVFKSISSKNISYENGHINNIQGITFKHKEVIITLNLYNITNHDQNNFIIIDKSCLSDYWCKFLKFFLI